MDIISYLKSQQEFWKYAKNQDFFGLKLKYAIWIIPIPFVGWFVLAILLDIPVILTPLVR
jgi:hypothetical protein